MQLCKQVSHFIQSVDFLGIKILKRFAVPSQLFVCAFHFRHKLLHFSEIRIILLSESYIDNPFIILTVWEMVEPLYLVGVWLEAVELWTFRYAEKSLNVFVVQKLGNV